MSAPALGFPDVSEPFSLFSHKKQGIALGILAQGLGPYRRAVLTFLNSWMQQLRDGQGASELLRQ